MRTNLERSEKLRTDIEAREKRLVTQKSTIANLKKAKLKIDHLDVASKRKADTRKKVLIGSYILGEMTVREEIKADVLAGLDRFLTRPDERALFRLDPLPVVSADPVRTDPLPVVVSSTGVRTGQGFDQLATNAQISPS